MPNVSSAEDVHIGMRSAISAVRLSFSHRRVQLTFIAFKTSRTRRVTLHLCSEGRPAGANLNRQSVATDKVRGHLVKPFACRIQLCKHLRFDRIRHFTHLVHSCRTRQWVVHTSREGNFHSEDHSLLLPSDTDFSMVPSSLSHIDSVQHLIGRQLHVSTRSHHCLLWSNFQWPS